MQSCPLRKNYNINCLYMMAYHFCGTVKIHRKFLFPIFSYFVGVHPIIYLLDRILYAMDWNIRLLQIMDDVRGQKFRPLSCGYR